MALRKERREGKGWQKLGSGPDLAFPVPDPDTVFIISDPDVNLVFLHLGPVQFCGQFRKSVQFRKSAVIDFVVSVLFSPQADEGASSTISWLEMRQLTMMMMMKRAATIAKNNDLS
ncbi:hypothetical protein WN943_014473 [Citrus x changshan-huyou]